MPRQIVLLRGVNLGARNRIAMPELREALTDAGFDDVNTYVHSGNVVLSSAASPERLARQCARVIDDRFRLDVGVVVRTRAELAKVVERDPLAKVATNPKRYQVTFLAAKPDPNVVRELAAAAVEPEQVVHIGRELYAWHPDGVGRSKLAALLSGPRLGVTATARNWATVTKLLEMANE
jgi:uncharacterized protein (DUF1697 family)